MKGFRFLLLVGILALAGCEVGAFFGPHPGQRYDALPEYAAWWADAERCAGKRGPLEWIEWRAIGDAATYWYNCFGSYGGECAAEWAPRHTIYIARGLIHDQMVVTHEMIHELLRTPGHPAGPFECWVQLYVEGGSAGRVEGEP